MMQILELPFEIIGGNRAFIRGLLRLRRQRDGFDFCGLGRMLREPSAKLPARLFR